MSQEVSQENKAPLKPLTHMETLASVGVKAAVSALAMGTAAAFIFALEFHAHMQWMLLSGLVVFVTGLITLTAAFMIGQRDPVRTSVVFMAGMFLRMVIGLSTVLLIAETKPDVGMMYAGWLVVWYTLGLFIETVLVVRVIPMTQASTNQKLTEETS